MTGPPTSPPAIAQPWEPACRFCNALIDRHEAARSGVCAAPDCRTQRLREASDRVVQRNWQAHINRLCDTIEAHGPEIDAAAAELGGDPTEIVYGLVPRQNRPVTPLPDERRAEFGSRLDQLVDLAFAEDPPNAQADRDGDEPEDRLMVSACTTCAGQCCTRGAASHAFLTVESIQRFRQRNPGTTRADVTAHYLGRLPMQSVEGSCVFHGERGCALPRTERAQLCNSYHCAPQIQLGRRFEEMGASKALIVACGGESTPVIGLHETGRGWRSFPLGEAAGAAPAQKPNESATSPAVAGAIAAAKSLTPPSAG